MASAARCNFPGCSYQFKLASALKTHEQKHKSDPIAQRPYACIHCSYRAATVGILKSHITRHHTNGYHFSCSFPGCDYKAEIARDVRLHKKRRHTCLPQISCTFEGCSYKTKLKKNLKAHVKNYHPANRRKNIDCPLCPKIFFYTVIMRNHLIMHTNEKPWQCSV